MSDKPMPIIIGAPRSGTTLLRLMLDAHPDLAIPPETGFLSLADVWLGQPEMSPDALVEAISNFPADMPVWPDFGLDSQALQARLEQQGCASAADGLRQFYQMYAERFGKARCGDKTPGYCFHVSSIARLLPEARFIHLIRDGRDVALSWRKTWFSPGQEYAVLARAWADHVQVAREQAHVCPGRVFELRYESLLVNPERSLREVCTFLELDFNDAMLSYHQGALGRLMEHQSRPAPPGRQPISWTQRFVQQRMTTSPPAPERAGVWRREMTANEQQEFEAVAGDLLRELGYMERNDQPHHHMP